MCLFVCLSVCLFVRPLRDDEVLPVPTHRTALAPLPRTEEEESHADSKKHRGKDKHRKKVSITCQTPVTVIKGLIKWVLLSKFNPLFTRRYHDTMYW